MTEERYRARIFLGEGRVTFPGPEAKVAMHLLWNKPKAELSGKIRELYYE
jgi:hypothetical protein